MTDEAIKKRLARARAAAANRLRGVGYGIIETRGGSVDLIGVRYNGALFVRVVLREPTVADMKAVRGIDLPTGCNGEIWQAETGEREGFRFSVKRVV